jgi:uncharacterized protein (TIGR02594 family)
MRTMVVNAVMLAERFQGLQERPGGQDHPLIMAMLKRKNEWVEHDETSWCSAFVDFVCWLLGLPTTGKLNARSWLEVGLPISLETAEQGFDVVILRRGTNPALGHVGFFYGLTPLKTKVILLGGNQSNKVSIATFPVEDVIGVRRLA